VIAGCALEYTGARADTILWAIDANANGTPTAPVIEKWDLNEPAGTGTLINSFLAPNLAAQDHQAQGIAVVGSNIFYSVADSGSVFLTNPSGTDLGIAFSTGLRGISTIASDGNFLYLGGIADHNVYKYTFGGTLVDTLNLIPSERPDGFGRVGLEVVGTDFVANQQQDIGPYDKFDAAGNLLVPMFIGGPSDFGKSGIAFDGTFYYGGDDEADPSVFLVYDASGASIRSLSLTGCPGPNALCDFRDLSIGATAIPEPGSLAMLSSALLYLTAMWSRRRGKQTG
jgi:hypothetical protein